jgi:hypothetical protein
MSDEDRRHDKLQAIFAMDANDFYVLGIEYARARALRMELRDGELRPLSTDDAERLAGELLTKLGERAIENLARRTIVPTEHEALDPAERHEARAAKQRGL